ncbi:hypothetical protein N1851_020119 [Merluccius polli]|uniref:Uncharacterized protein n=1 Tax=Merluccius polli TaxID=89951 RepID=A0AA47MKT0_MERPO|nr:hypothetical protein N1851_020119 [Merluccius polli]
MAILQHFSSVCKGGLVDLVDLAVHSGWAKAEKISRKAELRGIVEGQVVSAKLLEAGVQAPVAHGGPGVGSGTWSFEQCLQMEREKAQLERERFEFKLEQEKLKAEVAMDRERVMLERLRLEVRKEGRGEAAGGHRGFDVA